MNLTERRERARLGRMANRCGWRISRPKPDDPIDCGGFRLVDLSTDQVLLGEQFDASLAESERYLRREGTPKKTPLEMEENIVRQLAAKRGFVLHKTRRRLYVKAAGEYHLFRTSDRTTPLFPERRPSLDELKAFFRTQPVDTQRGFYAPRPTRAERISHA